MTPKAKDILARALRATGLAAEARLWFAFRPSVLAVTERLAYFVTERVPHPSHQPLLHVMLRRAFRDLAQARESKPDATETDLQVAYYNGLLRMLPALLEIRVSQNSDRWDPFVGVPLSDWLTVHPGARIEEVEPDPDRATMQPSAYRASMIAFLLSAHDMAELGPDIKRVVADPS